MKTILRVAGTEMKTLFYSPVAWLLLIAFYVQTGITYFGLLENYSGMQARGGEELKGLTFLTYQLFGQGRAVFPTMMQYLFLYLPLLTMGLLSRETGSGTIKLLYSSPVSIRQIVLGKYLSMLLFGALMSGVMIVYLVTAIFQVQHADMGILWPGLCGFYILIATYAAIGLFMSSLTPYQVIAAVCTFAMFACLGYVGELWQGNDLVRDVTYYLSINGRTANFSRGLIITRDLIYFLSIITVFICLTIYRLRGQSASWTTGKRWSRYLLTVITGIILICAGSLPVLTGYLDLSATRFSTLTPNARAITIALKSHPLEVYTYNNILDRLAWYGSPQNRKRLLSNWDLYQRFDPDIHFKFIHYYDEPVDRWNPFNKQHPGKTLSQVAEQYIMGMGLDKADVLTPAAMKRQLDLTAEQHRYVMQLRWNNRTTFLRLYDDSDPWPSETEVSAAFKRLLNTRMPRILFATGHLERDIYKNGNREYQSLTSDRANRYSLINQGFDTDTISLENRDIPAGITALVIADPRTEMEPQAKQRLSRYIAGGGNLLIAGEAGKQALLNTVLAELGVQLEAGQLVQPAGSSQPDEVLLQVMPAAQTFTTGLKRAWQSDSLPVTMDGVAPLSWKDTGNFQVRPLLTSDPRRSWLRKTRLVTDSAAITFQPGDERGTFTTAVALTRKLDSSEQRIIVTGDADFMSNSSLNRYDLRSSNYIFNIALFSWLDNGEFPVDTSRPPSEDNGLNVAFDSLDGLNIIYLWVAPVLMGIVGGILLIRRNRK